MSDTPETDALIDHHNAETKELPTELGLSAVSKHSMRQVKELIDHTRSLERRLRAAEAEVKHLGVMYSEERKRAEKAEAENAALRKDAERLTWAENNPEAAMRELVSWWELCGHGAREIWFGFRTRIDAAMKEKP
jgi:predicted solute-binding protein